MNQIDWLNGWEKFELSITTYCQAKCPLCARISQQTGKFKDFLSLIHTDFHILNRLIDDIAKYTLTKYVQICGDYGDPLMHPDIEKIIDKINEHNMIATIHTNGGIRNELFYKEIAKKKVIIIFGIDGIDENTNSKYRIGVNFDKAMKNMLTFAKAVNNKKQVVWDFLVFDYNTEQLDKALEIANNNNIQICFRINKRSWIHKINDKNLIKQINIKYKDFMIG
jgi:MoaA/NifB/PqqE/SkfB family radical SAM enzyme